MTTDWAQLNKDLMAVRDDNARQIVIRRGASTLPAQTARVELAGRAASRRVSGGGEQATSAVDILGDIGLDVRPQDRFTLDGISYEIIFVNPNRLAATLAEAVAVE